MQLETQLPAVEWNGNMNGIDNLVSIIIPVYNTEKYVDRCISSVLIQTYKNIEVVLVNDGSTDSSGLICEKYAAQDSRVVLINKENGGLSDARNVGIEAAEGEFISFVDSDDFVSEYYIESLYNTLIQYDADISMANFIRYFSENCQKVGNIYVTDMEESIISGMDAIRYILDYRVHENYVVSWNKLYRKSVFEGIRFPHGRINEDAFTTYKLFYKASKVAYVNEPLYYYVQRVGSIMNSDFSLKRYDLVEADAEFCNFCICHDIYIPEVTKKYLYDYWRFIYEYSECNLKDSFTEAFFKRNFAEVYKENRRNLSKTDRQKMDWYTHFPRTYWLFRKMKRKLEVTICEH